MQSVMVMMPWIQATGRSQVSATLDHRSLISRGTGTHVAGSIAAETNNGAGVAGAAFGAPVVPVRALGRCGGHMSDIADGIIWAAGGTVSSVPANANPAQVLNLSLGGSGSWSSTTQAAINTARSLGSTVVVVGGNESTDASNSTPANCTGVVTVAATNRAGARAYYSNYGSVVDVAAPGGGGGILSTLNAGNTNPGSDSFEFYQGTSMAPPHVAGVIALLYATDPAITPDGAESIIKNTARVFPGSCTQCGSGIVDATAAVAAAADGSGGGDVLENDSPVNGLAAAAGSRLYFTMDVHASVTERVFAMSGGSGDADLHVSVGAVPTASSCDCRPYLVGNNETCSISCAQEGTYNVMLLGFSAFSGVSLVGTYTDFIDLDGDGFTDSADNCTSTPNTDQLDADGDGSGDASDNCPLIVNTDQLDTNGDGRGNACEGLPAGC
jgi:serine protease